MITGSRLTSASSVTIRVLPVYGVAGQPDARQSSTFVVERRHQCDDLLINQGIGVVPCANGSVVVKPAANTTYTLTVTGPTGEATATATVLVAAAQSAPTLTSISPSSGAPGPTVVATFTGTGSSRAPPSTRVQRRDGNHRVPLSAARR